ncbi:MAG: hypothetical protein M3N50_14935 [Pseudomonadota bacterium]|nr:hypothetical protein [Pseudomonadota bacterium]
MTHETSPPVVTAHRSEAFLQSLDDVPGEEGLLVAMACYEIHLRLREMYLARAQIRGDEGDDC